MVGTAFAIIAALTFPQAGPQHDDPRIHDIVAAISADRIESNIRTCWVGTATEYRFEGLVIDNFFFGVAAVGHDGNESVIAFQSSSR